MDKMTYLNQISAAAPQPKKNKWQDLLASPLVKILLGLVAFTLVFFVFAGIMSANRKDPKNETITLMLHTSNVMTAISDYQNSIKSPTLRSYSSALNSILTSTETSLENYLTETYEWKEKDTPEKLTASETALAEELDEALFNAKISGKLDRTYAQEMAYQISYITTYEQELINLLSSNSELASSLASSQSSLENLYDNFNDFNEADPSSLKEL